MASPDVRPYVNLTLFDLTPQDLYNNAVQTLLTNLPGWVAREGNVEVLLLENQALMLSEGIFAINRLPAAITEIMAKLFGIERDPGAAPVANLEFTMVGTAGYTIPAGTQVRLDLMNNQVILFTTDVDLIIAPGFSTGQVLSTGSAFTDIANGVDNQLVPLIDSLLYVNQVEIVDPVSGGRVPETDDEYFTRATLRFSRLNDTLVLPSDFEARAMDDPAIYPRASVYDNWDSVGGSPGDDPGHVTVATYGPDRLNTSLEKSTLQTAMQNQAAAMLNVHVIDPTITTVAVTVSVAIKSGYLAADVIASVEDRLEEYLSPNTWEWGDTVYRNELISVIDQVEGVARVITLAVPAADVVLSAIANLVDAGTLTVTVP